MVGLRSAPQRRCSEVVNLAWIAQDIQACFGEWYGGVLHSSAVADVLQVSLLPGIKDTLL
jgi:hypothetical protein